MDSLEAYNAVMKLANDKFISTFQLMPYPPKLFFQKELSNFAPPVSEVFGKAFIEFFSERQRTLSNDEGFAGQRLYQINNILTFQLFAPPTESYQKFLSHAINLKNAFRGKDKEGCLFFTGCELFDLPPSGTMLRINIVIHYYYFQRG